MNIATIRKYRRRHRQVSGLLQQNPVLALGLDLPFVIVTGVALKNAAAISIMMLCVHIPTMLIAMLTCRKLPYWARLPINTLVATVAMVASRLWITRLFPTVTDTAGMYIYLLAVNGITMLQAGTLSRRQKLWPVMRTSFANIGGFALIMFFVSFVREYIGSGSLWGVPVAAPLRLTGVVMPFFGFILMGCLLALFQFATKKLTALRIIEARRKEMPYTDLK